MPPRFVRLLVVVALAVGLHANASPAGADQSPDGKTYRKITFPAVGKVTYYDDFGACRDGCARAHQGNDVMGAKLMPLVAAADAHVTFLRTDASGTSGNMVEITDDAGWSYWYLHVNNDSPGTDDGLNPAEYRFAPGIVLGARVTAGQTIAWMGDSGNAEGTGAHLHFEMHRPDDSAFSPYVSLRLAQGLPAGALCAFPSNPTPVPDSGANRGYWTVTASGSVYTFGGAPFFGGLNRPAGTSPVVDLGPRPNGDGYWLVDAAGDVHPFGAAPDFGSMAGTQLVAPMIGIEPTGTGNGYWLLAATAASSASATPPSTDRWVACGSTRRSSRWRRRRPGSGYWLLGADGGIFSFGDAVFQGSTGGFRLAAPVVGMATTASGTGYWLLGGDGGVFAFGDAPYTGSIPGTGLCTRPGAVSLTGTNSGHGYWVLTNDGVVVPFGDAVHYGDPKTYGVKPITLTAVG